MNCIQTCLPLLVCILLGQPIIAQQAFAPSRQRKQVKAVPASSPITIDGRLDETGWSAAMPADSFTQTEPRQGQPAFFKTTVHCLFDATHIYIGFTCYDTVGKNRYKAPDMLRDFDFSKHDLVGVTFDGFNDRRNSMSFLVNAYGAQRDYQAYDDTYFDVDWNGLWLARTTRTDSCWIAELAIPWRTLRYKHASPDSMFEMGINFFRKERTHNERSAWSPYPRSVGFDRVAYAGSLVNARPPQRSTNIQANLYTLLSYQSATGTETGNYRKIKPKAGGDIKWAITPNLVVDATLNTDFAQADADNQVNNVSRFSIFFPEKRQFFLESASLFGIGITPADDGSSPNLLLQPFFSRRIGLDKDNRPVPLDAGTRVVYRSDKRSIGLLAARQRATDISPLQHFFVTRYSENIGSSGRIGMIASAKSVAGTMTQPGYTNLSAGIDGLFRLDNKQSLNFMWLRAGDKKTSGWGGYLQYYYSSNALDCWWTEAWVDQSFNPEMGFVSRKDVLTTAPGFRLKIRRSWVPLKKYILEYTPGASGEWYHQASSGKLVENVTRVTPLHFYFIKGGSAGYQFFINHQYLAEEFVPLGIGIREGTYKFVRQELYAATNASLAISGSLRYQWGRYFDGRMTATTATLVIAPVPYVSVKAGMNRNQFSRVGKENISKAVILYSIQPRLALNPRLQLSALYQWNTFNKQTSYNIRFSWEYRPLSYLHLVINSRHYTTTSVQQEENAILKFSYLRQL